jgi:hypothetical protein
LLNSHLKKFRSQPYRDADTKGSHAGASNRGPSKTRAYLVNADGDALSQDVLIYMRHASLPGHWMEFGAGNNKTLGMDEACRHQHLDPSAGDS